ncbi:MAG: hypothetical protein ACLVIH_17915 [Paraclostridium sordellii]
MSNHVLRWQKGLLSGEVKMYYTYGHLSTLKEKAKNIAEDDKVVFVSIDKIEEVIKDTRTEKMIEYIENNTIK